MLISLEGITESPKTRAGFLPHPVLFPPVSGLTQVPSRRLTWGLAWSWTGETQKAASPRLISALFFPGPSSVFLAQTYFLTT